MLYVKVFISDAEYSESEKKTGRTGKNGIWRRKSEAE